MKKSQLFSFLVLSAIVVVGGMLAIDRLQSSETSVAAFAKETHFHGIAVDPADSSRIYLATHHGLYVIGTDGRAQQISQTRDDYMGFTAHPTDPSHLFASGHPPEGGNLGFIVSKDGGRTWSKLSDGVNGPVDFHQMDVSKADPDVIYGVYGSLQRSTDGGATWEAVGPPPRDIIALAASSLDVDTLYAATQDGLQLSTDGGRTWKPVSDRTATMVYVTPDGAVYAFMVGMGLVRASEKNLAWQVVSGDFDGEFLLHFAVDPQDAQQLYAITFDSRTRAQNVIASRDGGKRWARLGAE